MTTPRAPNAPNPYHQGELLPTVRVDDDGNEISGQGRVIAQGNALEKYRTEAKKASRNLTNEFNYESNDYKAPSTPTRGGTRRKKRHGGADSGNDEKYKTPPTSPQKPVAPGAPERHTANNRFDYQAPPQELFPRVHRVPGERRKIAQGGTRQRSKRTRGKKTKRTKRSHKKTRRTHKKSKSHRKRR